MTRINLVPVEELSDQHLFAEYRELPRMASFANKSTKLLSDIPDKFRLGSGHMTFFLNKGNFLENRHKEIVSELLKRNINFTVKEDFTMPRKYGNIDYVPDEEEVEISRGRIQEKLNQKPEFYRWTRKEG